MNRLFALLGVVALTVSACSSGDTGGTSATAASQPVRQAAAACPEVTASKTTSFTVSNNSTRDWNLRVVDIDCYDWSGVSTPAGLEGSIPAGRSVSARIEARPACPGSGLPIPIPDRQGRFTLILERADGSGLTARVPVVYQCNDFNASTGSGTYCDPMLSGAQSIMTDIIDANGSKKGILTGSISCGIEYGSMTFKAIP